MSKITIYHNSKCKTSRDVLEKIIASGVEPTVVLYLQNPPSESELRNLVKLTGESVRKILRQKGTPYEELDLGNPKWSDDELIGFIMAHPILLNRPIVSNGKMARLCRPIETVLDVLK